jgi:hypothetical protein
LPLCSCSAWPPLRRDGDDSGGGDGGAKSNTIKSGLKIAFLPKQVNNPYFTTAGNGGKTAVGEFKGTYSETGPSEASASSQVSYINTLSQQKTDVIVVSANDKDAICGALNEARQAGTKVVTYDSDTKPDCRDLFVNQANRGGHREVADQAHLGRGRPGRREDRDPLGDGERHEPERLDRDDEDGARQARVQQAATRRDGVRRRRRPEVVHRGAGPARQVPGPQGHHLADDGRRGGGRPVPQRLGVQGQGGADRSRHAQPDAGVREGRHLQGVRAVEPGRPRATWRRTRRARSRRA